MSQQIQITGGAKVRNLEGVLTGTAGVVNALGINVPSGIPQLDGSGKILVSQLPNSVMEYKGTWNAATNTPTLANGTGNQGDVYLCNVAGTVNFGSGPITFAVGDQTIYSGTIWQKAGGATGTVTSVSVTETGDALTITGSPITTSGTINIGFAGTSGQYVNGAGGLTTFPTIANEAQRLITEVYNETGATLTKGTVIYINGGHGNLPTITKAIATGDATSAQTYGIVQNNITNNNNGFVVVIGSLMDLDTQAYADGTQLYLSSTVAGAWTSVKQYAPAHLVYVGIVTRSHPTQGVVEVRIQNGFEMDELHNVAAQSPSNGDILQYVSSTSLWTKTAGTTTNIAEGTNLYYTDARARASNSFVAGSGAYNSTTGVITIPTNNNQITNGAGYITSSALSAYVPYTGATTNVDLGTNTFASQNVYVNGNNTTNFGFLGFKQIGGSGSTGQSGYTSIYAIGQTSLYFNYNTGSTTYRKAIFSSVLIADNTERLYYLPASDGTLALTSQLTSGTVTSVGLSSATSGVTIGSSPITTSGTITLAIATASGSQNGLLSSTDWTTFNGKQNALTNPITGTGTTNYIPKFTASGTIGNSLIYDTGTRIAIGGTSATYGVLTVQSDSGQFCIQSNTTPGKQLQIGYDHTTNNSYLSSLNQGVGFTPLFLQPNGGNVGVGATTDNGARLEIKGGYTAFQYNSSATGPVYPSYNTYFGAIGTNFSNGGIELDIWNTIGGGFVFRKQTGASAQTALMTITSGGNVLIGANTSVSSVANLQVFGSTQVSTNNGQIRINDSVTTSKTMSLGVDGTNNVGFIQSFQDGVAYRSLILNGLGGNVAIGTTNPQGGGGGTDRTLGINSGSGSASFLTGLVGDVKYSTLFTSSSIVVLETNAAIPLAFNTNATERMRITSGGNVLIGLTSSSNKFTVSAGGTFPDLYVNSSGGIGSYNFGTGLIYSNAGILSNTAPSDKRLKENINDISWGLTDILKLRPVTFYWKDDRINQGVQFGFIAQEVLDVMPEAIKEFGDDVKYLGLEKDAIYATLVKAIQEQQAQIEELKAKIK
jgi:hypothetical protein